MELKIYKQKLNVQEAHSLTWRLLPMHVSSKTLYESSSMWRWRIHFQSADKDHLTIIASARKNGNFNLFTLQWEPFLSLITYLVLNYSNYGISKWAVFRHCLISRMSLTQNSKDVLHLIYPKQDNNSYHQIYFVSIIFQTHERGQKIIAW